MTEVCIYGEEASSNVMLHLKRDEEHFATVFINRGFLNPETPEFQKYKNLTIRAISEFLNDEIEIFVPVQGNDDAQLEFMGVDESLKEVSLLCIGVVFAATTHH